MTKKIGILWILSIALAIGVSAQDSFRVFKLKNGLTVFLWEDHTLPDVSGSVVFKAGSVDEPEEYSGLAHYLEHVLFKGTQKIGALNWEKEEPLYNEIIRLYDRFSDSKDEAERARIEKKINEISIQAAQYARTNEFSGLVDGMGGEGLNAGTSYDMTLYYNSFPAYQMEKWLDLYAERFIQPVFRSFQAELENVFEEYNMYQDNQGTHIRNFLFSHLYAGHPYGRDIIGTPENLKNPRLSKLIEFYNTWYVPENMALILVGNFEINKVRSLIQRKFSKLPAKKAPERKVHTSTADFKSNKRYTAKLSYYPQIFWGYKGVEKGHPDELLLQFCTQILSNSSRTGLLDKLTLDGDLLSASAFLDSRKDEGRVILTAVPYYDVSQRRYESERATEKQILAEVEKLKNGDIPDWLIQAVRDNMLRQYKLIMETPRMKSDILTELFVYNLPYDYYANKPAEINAITKEDIQRIGQQYFSGDRITLFVEAGTPKKEKLKKPDIKPIEQPRSGLSEYGKYLQSIPVTPVKEEYNDFADVKKVKLYDRVTLHYTENKVNDLFTLNMRYGVGEKKMPKLKYAVRLMGSAGIMPSDDAQTVRRQFSELDAQCNYTVNDDYFTISLLGAETNLSEICRLMTRQVLFPKLDDKQLNSVKAAEYNERMIERKDIDAMGDALLQYALYKDKSEYIDRIKMTDVLDASIPELTGEIIRASEYELDIFYCGAMPVEEVTELLKANLPLKEGVKPSESPIVEETENYSRPTILFLHNRDAQQAKIYFYTQGEEYKTEDAVYYQAFYNYLSGGFNGLLMQEIRENNSMAYTTFGRMMTPPIQNKKAYFLGFIGTQPDKAADAVDLYIKILIDMPQHPDRIDNIKTNLKQSNLTNKPSFRQKAMTFDRWQRLGYTNDPAQVNMPKIDALQFDDIMNFYNSHIKGKPMTIVIMADHSKVNTKQIESNIGKITKVSASTLFSKE